ncbi:MAG: GrdX family protein [Ezakiella sp.]|nr:GrdX family protein [Ezakiella sp.]
MKFIVTNNDYVRDKFKDILKVDFVEGEGGAEPMTYLPVLLHIRDLVHAGYKLLTHPLSGSIKPNETPYKSVIMEKGKALDEYSLSLIEGAIVTMQKFQNIEKTPNWLPRVLDDFKVVDLSLMENTILKLGHF